MSIKFTKYHGTGNDFIIIDDRNEAFDIGDTLLINNMCSRRFGIGADGLILLRIVEGFDFQMVYFNSDGNQSSMCGNGGRCIVHFSHSLGLFTDKCTFLAIDGPHEAHIVGERKVKLKMGDVGDISRDGDAYVLDTGSPHYVTQVKNLDQIHVKEAGAEIRYSTMYVENGINVNFVESIDVGIRVATYERGVEDETFSCGTGVTAAAIAMNKNDSQRYTSPMSIETKGGSLKVYFTEGISGYVDIWLEGPAIEVFEGEYDGS